MRKLLLLATVAALAMTAPAKADLVLFNPADPGGTSGTPTTSFIDVSGFGFGAIHRLVTLQTTGMETGNSAVLDTAQGQAISGADKVATPTLSELGWLSRDAVGLFFDADQVGNTILGGITLRSLTVSIVSNDGATTIGSFSLASPINFSKADLALEPGNGQGGFFFALTTPEQAEFDTILGLAGAPNFRVTLAASLGCLDVGEVIAGCNPSNDGPDSFNAVSFAAVPGPIAGAGIPGIIAACAGLVMLSRRRKVCSV
jgi:hypothetical protein